MSKRFKYLSSPFKLGNLTINNRIVFGAHLTNLAAHNMPSEQQAYYYAERAKGGAGLIITEELSVRPSNRAYEKLVDAFEEEVIPKYKRITSMVHKYGAKIFAQINHNGTQCSSMHSKFPVWGPSPIPDNLLQEVPKEMDLVDIQEVIGFYAKCAILAKKGGFDGIELQGSNSSLLQQFMSPVTNNRWDEYGGNLDCRIRLVREIGQAVRKAVGPDYVMGIRLSGDEFVDGGITLQDTVETAKKIEEMQTFDFINTSVGTATRNLYLVKGSMCLPPAYTVYIASAIKKAVMLPVITAGRIKNPCQAEQIIKGGHADLVGIVRAQITDPEFANKSLNGREKFIRQCLSCNQDCVGRVGTNRSIGCVQNPAVGKEKEWGVGTLEKVEKPKRVMVVGGGPAGLETAKTAALRGHYVILCEKDQELGGQIRYASVLPQRAELAESIRNLVNDLNLDNIEVKMGCTVTAEMIEKENPDCVIIATGSLPQKPMLPGCDQQNVCTVLDVLTNKIKIGQKVLVVDQTGFYQATGIAEYLMEQGKDVEVISPSLYIGQGLGRTLDLELWYQRAYRKGIKLTPNVSFMGVDGDKVKAIHNYSGTEFLWDHIDNVVLALPHKVNDELYRELKGKIKELYRIGDCMAPRKLDSAIIDGHRVARIL